MSQLFLPRSMEPVYGYNPFSDCPLFRDLSVKQLFELRRCGTQIELGADEPIFDQFSPCTSVFNVISGAIVVERFADDGRRQIIGFLFPGDYLGIVNSARYEVAARSLTKSTLYRFGRKKLVDFSLHNHQLRRNIEHIMSNVFYRLMEQLFILGQKKAHERLCFLFVHLLERMPGATPEHIQLYMSRQDIADYLGLTIETVSRSLAKLKTDGLIHFPSINHLQILNVPAVRKLAAT